MTLTSWSIQPGCSHVASRRPAKGGPTPIIPIWMSDRMGEGYRMLVEGGFAPPRSVGKAIKAIQRWIEYGRWKRTRGGHTPLNTGAALAPAVEDAVAAANTMGYPVVAKIASEQIVHKSDIGGVVVGLKNADELRQAWEDIMAAAKHHRPDAHADGLLIEKMAPRGGLELMVGVTRDPVFGHVMTFGLGGIYVEILRDV